MSHCQQIYQKSLRPLFMHEYKNSHLSAQGFFSLWQGLNYLDHGCKT